MDLAGKNDKQIWEEYLQPSISDYFPVDTIVDLHPRNGDLSIYLNNVCRWFGAVGDTEKVQKRLPRGKYQSLRDWKDKSVDMFVAWGATDWNMTTVEVVLGDVHPVLVKGGLVVLHHSNWLESRAPKNPFSRTEDMSASRVAGMAESQGYKLESQDPIEWGQPYKTDCLTILKK